MEYNAGDIIERLESLRGQKLSEGDQVSIETWEKGRKLATTVSTEGWPIAIELLTNYVVKSLQDLANTDPREKEEVMAAHSVTFVASRLLKIFQEDINSWIESSRITPKVIKETIDSQSKLEL
jgi:hypothetical protein